jgi:hypothetical protein
MQEQKIPTENLEHGCSVEGINAESLIFPHYFKLLASKFLIGLSKIH